MNFASQVRNSMLPGLATGLFCFAVLFPHSALAQSLTPVGTAVMVEGVVTIKPEFAAAHSLRQGDKVLEGDEILTGPTGEVHLEMKDKAFIALRPGAHFRITSYRAEGDEDDHAGLDLFKGALRTISGWVGHYNRKNYAINTPTATIGIRGTDHELLVSEDGTADSPAGTYEHVIQGATTMRDAQGSVDIDAGAAGFISARRGSAPVLLSVVPNVFPKGKHDDVFAGLHDKIQGGLEAARDAKRNGAKNDGGKDNSSAEQSGDKDTDKSGGEGDAEKSKSDQSKAEDKSDAGKGDAANGKSDDKDDSDNSKRDSLKKKAHRPKPQ